MSPPNIARTLVVTAAVHALGIAAAGGMSLRAQAAGMFLDALTALPLTAGQPDKASKPKGHGFKQRARATAARITKRLNVRRARRTA